MHVLTSVCPGLLVLPAVCLQVCLEMVKPDVPEDTTVDFSLEFVWKATSFDRMNTALKLFKDYSASISGYLFHVLLGHEVSLHCFFVQPYCLQSRDEAADAPCDIDLACLCAGV
jgi:hypothetical protein